MTAAYFGSLWVGAHYFPNGYDWRRNVISNLLSPRDNPEWYRVPSLGVALAGLCMLPLILWIEGELGESGGRALRRVAFIVGAACLALSALVVPQHQHAVAGLRHAHELLARTSAVGLGLGMLCACFARVKGERLRVLRRMWWVATAPTILGAVGSGVMVAMVRLGVPGAMEAFRGTVFWHLAFWAWVGAGAVFLFFFSAVILVKSRELECGKLECGVRKCYNSAPPGGGVPQHAAVRRAAAGGPAGAA